MAKALLQLTDGLTTLNLNGPDATAGTDIRLVSDEWAPVMPRMPDSTTGGRPFQPVPDSIPLYFRGGAVAALKAQRVLDGWMRRARAWARGYGDRSIRLRWQPVGGTRVLDVPIGDDPTKPPIEVAPTLNQDLATGTGFIRGAKLNHTRYGAWCGAREEAPTVSASQNAPNVHTATWTSAVDLAAIKLRLAPTNENMGGNLGVPGGVFVYAPSAGDIRIINASFDNMPATGLSYAENFDTTSHPRGGRTLLVTPSAASTAYLSINLENLFTPTVFDMTPRTIAAWLMCENIANSTDIFIRWEIRGAGGVYTAEEIRLAPGLEIKEAVPLPTLTVPEAALITGRLYIGRNTITETGTDRLEINYLCVAIVDGPGAGHLTIPFMQTNSNAVPVDIVLDDRTLEDREPFVGAITQNDSPRDEQIKVYGEGDSYLTMRGTTFAFAYLATFRYSDYWQPVTFANTEIPFTITAERRPLLPTPE